MARAKQPPRHQKGQPRPAGGARTPEQIARAKKLERRKAARDERVNHIADMMRDLTFRTGRTGRALAALWGEPQWHVDVLTSEASRRVRAEFTDHDAVLSKVGVALDRVISEAMVGVGDAGPCHRDVIQAAKLYAEVSGASAPQKLEVSGDLTGLTDEQVAARKAAILARLSAPATSEGAEEHDEGVALDPDDVEGPDA